MRNPAWSPNAPVAAGKVIVDPSGNVQQWSAAPGSTGAIPPAWGSVLGTFTADGAGGLTCGAGDGGAAGRGEISIANGIRASRDFRAFSRRRVSASQ